MPMNILGISDVTGNHSHSCVVLMQDGKLTFALSQERISRIKNDSNFPYDAIQAALEYSGLNVDNIDFFTCAYPPANYYHSLMAHSRRDLPRSLFQIALYSPLKLGKYIFPNIRKGLLDTHRTNGLFKLGVPREKFCFIDHHLAHVSATYFSSPFKKCLGISYGGFAPHDTGKNVAGAVFFCHGDNIQFLEDIPMFATGCFFSGIAVALGFTYMQQEGKISSLAALGDNSTCYEQVCQLAPRFQNGKWQPTPYWIDFIMSPRKEVFLATKSGRALNKILGNHSPQDLAAAAQRVWEENILSFISHLKKKYAVANFVLSGGVFNNSAINSSVANLLDAHSTWVHPFPGDGSTPIGAIIETHRQKAGKPLRFTLNDMGLGLYFSKNAIIHDLKRAGNNITYKQIQGDVSQYTAQQIADGKIVGWFQGREEYGPRSLGYRCILADPRSKVTGNRLTKKIKKRDLFIPISLCCLSEYGSEYFKDFEPNPFMTRLFTAIPQHAKRIPAALYQNNTARVQTVDKEYNFPFRKIIEYFYSITKLPMILNTSLNKHGEPIVHRPIEAIELLQQTDLDELIIGSYSVKLKK